MNPHNKRIVHSSSEAGWRTPPELFIALDDQFHFTVDVCASAESAYCDQWYGPDHPDGARRDALQHPSLCWTPPPGWAFINPPWSVDLHRRESKRVKLAAAEGYEYVYNGEYLIDHWVQHCAITGTQHGVVAILPYSHQTEWWYQWIRHGPHKAQEIREIPHRVSFLRADGTKADNAGGNTAVVIWYPNPGYVGDWVPRQIVWDYL